MVLNHSHKVNGSNFFGTLRSFKSCHLGNNHIVHIYPLVICYSLLLKMTIEIDMYSGFTH